MSDSVSVSLVLDLAGVLVFALSGALLAARRDLDAFGVVILAIVAGLGGGLIRDVLLGALPPAALRDERYLLCAVVAGAIGFRFHIVVERLHASIRLLDALGLGFFAVAGTFKALDADLGPVSAVLLGLITAIGGGIIRDLLVAESPVVLRRDIYAVPALLAAIIVVSAERADISRITTAIIAVTVAFAVRALALRYNWQAPRPRS